MFQIKYCIFVFSLQRHDMKILRILLITTLLFTVSTTVDAQKKGKGKGKAAIKQKVEKMVVTEKDLMFENMLESMQRVFIIDSVVVDKGRFLDHIPLPAECGKLIYDNEQNGIVYVNGFGNKSYYSVADSIGNAAIYTADKLDGQWTTGQTATGIDAGNAPNYPFMMADGVTFYFAQKGEDSLGGYDIFVTRYDGETGEFLKPNNIGLPFNSKANDYMYVEDELDSLGWFATDRNQPEGKVCVYTFVPSRNRMNIDTEKMGDEEIRNWANIASISATWPNKKARGEALKRLAKMKERTNRKQTPAQTGFVINDATVYRSSAEFKSAAARNLFEQWILAKDISEKEEARLENMRDEYSKANPSKRKAMAATILEKEKSLEKMNVQIKADEKKIRNLENESLIK